MSTRDQYNNQMYYARSIMDLIADLHDHGASCDTVSLKGACIAALEHLDAADKAHEEMVNATEARDVTAGAAPDLPAH